MEMDFQGDDSLRMCASCWRIQPPEDELLFEVDQWVDPMTFMAQMGRGTRRPVRFVDTYCTACLIESAVRVQSTRRPTHEPLNA